MTNHKKLSSRHRVTEAELPLFFDLIRGKGQSKNKPTCENAVSQTLYGSCTLQMGSCQHKNSSNFQMATFSYVCQLSLISIRKQIKSVVCHRHIPTKGDVMCYLFNDLETQLDETSPNCAGDHDENQVDEYSDGSDSSDSEMDIDDEIEDDLTFLRTTRSGRSITINRSLF